MSRMIYNLIGNCITIGSLNSVLWGANMQADTIRDLITIEGENGEQLSYEVEAMFDMKGETFALLRTGDDTVLMKVEEDQTGQHLVNIKDKTVKASILDAYQIAVEASPAE